MENFEWFLIRSYINSLNSNGMQIWSSCREYTYILEFHNLILSKLLLVALHQNFTPLRISSYTVFFFTVYWYLIWERAKVTSFGNIIVSVMPCTINLVLTTSKTTLFNIYAALTVHNLIITQLEKLREIPIMIMYDTYRYPCMLLLLLLYYCCADLWKEYNAQITNK